MRLNVAVSIRLLMSAICLSYPGTCLIFACFSGFDSAASSAASDALIVWRFSASRALIACAAVCSASTLSIFAASALKSPPPFLTVLSRSDKSERSSPAA